MQKLVSDMIDYVSTQDGDEKLKRLKELLVRVANLNPDVEAFRYFHIDDRQAELARCVALVAQAKFLTPDGKLVPFFEGTYTLVATNSSGYLAGVLTVGGSPLYQQYNNKLIRFAVAKMLQTRYLDFCGRTPEISAGDNQSFLQGLDGNMPHVYWGGSTAEVTGDTLTLGAGGCEISLQLLRSLFAEDFLKTYGYFGGLGDQLFLRKLTQALQGDAACSQVTPAEIWQLLQSHRVENAGAGLPTQTLWQILADGS